jgi:hypothetical protein
LPKRTSAALVAAAALAMPAVAGAQESATVTVVHGIPGTPVDVYADGERLLDDFQPETVTDPLSLPAGDYELALRPADAGADADPILTAEASVEGGQDVSVVAHLDAEGEPTITPFANDTGEVPAGQARLTVRHTAAAPAVDVLAGGDPVIEGLENPDEESLEVDAGTIEAAVAAAGETDPVIGPQSLDLAAGANLAVYAVGSLEDETTTLLVQQIGGAAGAPGGVPGGDSGLVADDGAPTPLLLGLLAAGALGAAASLLVLRRRAEH